MSEKSEMKRAEVVLKKSHTHGGEMHKEGSTIKIREDQKKRLQKKGII